MHTKEGMYRNKYRINSNRHVAWDYSRQGFYFVTVCTKNFVKYFGEIQNEKIKLSSLGKIANDFWGETPKHFKNVILDEYIIMPNHIHGIIEINKSDSSRDAINRVSTKYNKNHPNTTNPNAINRVMGYEKNIVIWQIQTQQTRFMSSTAA